MAVGPFGTVIQFPLRWWILGQFPQNSKRKIQIAVSDQIAAEPQQSDLSHAFGGIAAVGAACSKEVFEHSLDTAPVILGTQLYGVKVGDDSFSEDQRFRCGFPFCGGFLHRLVELECFCFFPSDGEH